MRKKTKFMLYPLILVVVLIVLVWSCKKDDTPSLKSNTIINSDGKTGTVADIEGNVYKIVKIGTQWWMAENLKTTMYNDSSSISLVTDNTAWSLLETGAYCFFNNDASNSKVYGVLYNWYAVTDSRNLAPKGWHIPSDTELQTLITYLGGTNVAGGKLKEEGTTHWDSPNTGATNESNFTALPGSYRNRDGVFGRIGDEGYWWTSAYTNTESCYLGASYGDIRTIIIFKTSGFSVRCVKDLDN